ncbi:preprotein translocase subunit SecD [Halogranum rubrum]|uniref:Protein-export membrane protein SecD n=1 Tax=Halogranum rubrum TaxID=553466 RepID=A0A1I4B0X8_9EURY|nr:preprotein translocase subunit SecD [Halogranum rubrum]SFK62562.1 preprotein translocase subunit SecD [Halogranum rubrum]
MGFLRDNWRVILLVVVLLGSTFALFAPPGLTSGSSPPAGGDNATRDGPTNLQFGLELSGGTRIRAPLVGVTAEEVEFGNESLASVEDNVTAELDGVPVTDVTAQRAGPDQPTNAVEVTAENVSTQQLANALDAAGYQHGDVREGVTETTRRQTVAVLESKINEAGLSGGTVQQVTTSTGEHFILIEVPGQDRSDVLDLVDSRGSVRIDIYYQTENGTYQTREAVLEQGDFRRIGAAEQGEGQFPPNVPVVVGEDKAEEFRQDVVETGVAQPGGTTCRYEDSPNNTDPCLLTKVDGEVVYAAGMSPSLASSMLSGEWTQDPQFILATQNFSEAQTLAINLRAGALPAQLDIGEGGEGTSSFISPSQGEDFKRDSLITGLIAVLAVSAVVFVRYGEAKVALPMIVTALSEVVILLGFAAAIGYPIDLSVIAGFIAVIGTGVDDLIIIADEVMQEGEIRSRKIFQSRFKKAFWVIGAAAATTIIAMSPLAVLSLGDLQGFAIFTILGVIAGVLLTRPAYGDILRALLTDDR